jgi:hypothetical protein
MKQPGAGSEDVVLSFGIKNAELYNERGEGGDRNEHLGEAKLGSGWRSLVVSIYFRKYGSQNRPLLKGSQNWIQGYRSSLVIRVDMLAESLNLPA